MQQRGRKVLPRKFEYRNPKPEMKENSMGKPEGKAEASDLREKRPEVKEKELQELQDFLAKKEAALETREKMLAEQGPSVAPAADEERPLTKEQEKLIADGCKAYGIDKKHLFHTRIDRHTGEAVLVTNGGAKVRFAKDGTVKPLPPLRVHGIPPEKTHVVMGKKK
jgi:hypothetical protein